MVSNHKYIKRRIELIFRYNFTEVTVTKNESFLSVAQQNCVGLNISSCVYNETKYEIEYNNGSTIYNELTQTTTTSTSTSTSTTSSSTSTSISTSKSTSTTSTSTSSSTSTSTSTSTNTDTTGLTTTTSPKLFQNITVVSVNNKTVIVFTSTSKKRSLVTETDNILVNIKSEVKIFLITFKKIKLKK